MKPAGVAQRESIEDQRETPGHPRRSQVSNPAPRSTLPASEIVDLEPSLRQRIIAASWVGRVRSTCGNYCFYPDEPCQKILDMLGSALPVFADEIGAQIELLCHELDEQSKTDDRLARSATLIEVQIAGIERVLGFPLSPRIAIAWQKTGVAQ